MDDTNGFSQRPKGFVINATTMQWFIFLLLLAHMVITQLQFDRANNKLDTLQLAIMTHSAEEKK